MNSDIVNNSQFIY